ncbi:MAG: tail fiber domain-containing protein, partial [Bacteroidota bacterium]
MKFSFLLMVGALCALLTLPAWGQTGVGTPSSSIQFSTNGSASGGVAPLGHGQENTFGDIGGKSTWAAIGAAPFSPPGVAAPYGLRVQRRESFGLFNLIDGISFGSFQGQDLIVGFGEDKDNTLRIRYISNQFTNTFRDLAIFGDNSISINTASSTGVNAINRADGSSSVGGSGLRGLTFVDVVPSFGSVIGTSGTVFNQVGGGTDYGGYFSVSLSLATTRAAGFFQGDLVYTGALQGPSDRKLKRNIQEETGHLERLMQLNTYTYDFKTDEYDYMG